MNGNGQERRDGVEFWVISASRTSLSHALTIECAEGEALVVFGFREEADMFLDSGGFGSGWSIRTATIPELFSLLDEPHENVRWIVLDPLPRSLGERGDRIALMSRERFTEFLVRRVWVENRAIPSWMPGGDTPPASCEEQEITGE